MISGGIEGQALARVQIEQAEIDPHVAVRGLHAAQFQNARAQARMRSSVTGRPASFQREIGLDRRADFRGTLQIDIESAVRQLPSKESIERPGRPACTGRRIPDPIHRRMQPELQQNVVGFEGRVRGEFCPPISFRELSLQERRGRLPDSLDRGIPCRTSED